ncbi:hypothetical protein TNIN_127891 [Trichonephila inaurata madagascariensis]|uniref:Uncharacterized protein n=1 Tax=Trichonephila inaurata madagascariensis TaxID=2747483 RepID=A0A8X6YVH2_9ARAC|nr:hypothetical protein TNIN_127891 [Trichonephila inaurata madagascariensis]
MKGMISESLQSFLSVQTRKKSKSACVGNDFTCVNKISSPYEVTPVELYDFNNLHLSKRKVEILASRPQQWNFFAHITFISNMFFKKEGSLVFCYDTDDLLKELHFSYEPNEWWMLQNRFSG